MASGLERSRLAGTWRDAMIILLAVFALRCIALGNPNIHVDEDFYLLVGRKMWEGALPFVDIWDRKPIGLFLIYAVAAPLGNGVLAYQCLATLSVMVTSLILYRMGRCYADRPTAVLAAIVYPTILNLFEGVGGQSPVFYNLPMTAAAAMLMSLFIERDHVPFRRLVSRGVLAMLLVGIALQVKYSVVGEGGAFGLMLLWLAWRRSSVVAALGCGLLWAGIALAPTLLAFGYYALQGQAEAFLFANFLSIALRGGEEASVLAPRLLEIFKVLALPLGFALAGLWARLSGWRGLALSDAHRFILFWNGAAWLTFAGFGTYFTHYALALAGPVALAFAFSSGLWLRFRSVCIVAGAVASIVVVRGDLAYRGGPDALREMARAMRDTRNCPYVYAGSAMLYTLGDFCLPTRFAFPYHLNLTREYRALGVDADAELHKITNRMPDYMVAITPPPADLRPDVDRAMHILLRKRYDEVMRYHQGGGHYVVLYHLKPGFVPLPNAVDYGREATGRP
ncbi:glycosyltransferase family 39 protein [Sphingobium sufflavum]|uniref:ArnT family glycosyltransferase n=1 Tax=Sphingobium sufflavum TaxID=1129547 RepID=UPI001F202DE7|nr:glycosyltransferase family 39 protein [Sphingobium sufflavum]MCE7797917.1 glycosyltransferase family 39 protein [Sphingobium sufflavum]